MENLKILENLNTEYLKLHKEYENYFWISYMWDHSIDAEYEKSQKRLDDFKSNNDKYRQVLQAIETEQNSVTKTRLNHWKYFFELNLIPEEVKDLKNKINQFENKLQEKIATQNTWYIDPETNEFVKASNSKMRLMIRTESDEKLRKACFDGVEKTIAEFVEDYIQLVKWRNEFARKVGYKNFYEYKAQTEERMSSKEIFDLFDGLYKKLSKKFPEIRDMEKDMPWLMKPWNFSYMMAGDFTKQEDQYLLLNKVLKQWGEQFTALWIDFQWAKMKLDLLEREWKYNNGFCHQPIPNHYENWKIESGETNFTCTAIPGQVWSGSLTWDTLFHEWWHAAHFANMIQEDVILNTEYAPMGVAWAETQSMFIESIFAGIDWKCRYASNNKWEFYPFELYEKKVRKLHKLAGNWILSIASIVKFEETIYNANNDELTKEFVVNLAWDLSIKYFDFDEESLFILSVPHIYSWNSSAYYHGYGMASLALEQIKDYFYETDWYIVDNPNVWKVLTKWWNYWSSLWFKELIKEIIGKDFWIDSFVNKVLKSEDEVINEAKDRAKKLIKIPKFKWNIDLNCQIQIWDWERLVGESDEWFDVMCENFSEFIESKFKS